MKTFYQWLKEQKGRNDVVGDFAGDALRDEDFPQAIDSWKELNRYLHRKPNIWDMVLRAAKQAWEEYAEETKKERGMPQVYTLEEDTVEKLENALDTAVQIAQAASDWNLEEIEIDGEFADTWILVQEMEEALALVQSILKKEA